MGIIFDNNLVSLNWFGVIVIHKIRYIKDNCIDLRLTNKIPEKLPEILQPFPFTSMKYIGTLYLT